MNRFVRLWPYGAFLVVCWSGTLVVPPAKGPGRPSLGWARNGLEVSTAEEYERQRALDDEVAQMQRRLLMKQQLVDQVIGQRLALREAAAQWRALLETNPRISWEMYRRVWPGNSDTERHCWQVIDAVKIRLRKNPTQAAAVAAALEAELRDHLKHGTLRLPSAP
jgi:hypothetical protein